MGRESSRFCPDPTDPSARAVPALGRDDILDGREGGNNAEL